ncbi:MAG: PhnD/SsuA/transferrin family substrate-binding protein [Sedimenticola selenatireducens]|uniref:histidine kinase n=1 Tax=Sedimenticola selenatireducens TaxID=191960 RepID=A0A558DND0_9GAMM|nr:PhnD/SsuA/transferrin family substrate-binding protein [Sedimenticola selenatireducens]TVT62463.1 MAG: PhnD/SsuA/transferrin family substrate-binding protein [Sedimenticola selenatireducens]
MRIGVLSHRGNEATYAMWAPTATYLSRVVPRYQFEIVPLDFDEVDPAVKFGQVDFILVNPGIYVNLEVRYRISRIATLNNQAGDVANNVFGGVIFTRQDRHDINTLADLKGKSLLAVDVISLGGFQTSWRELKAIGLDPYKDMASLSFGGIHDDVVRAVRDGRVDVGMVRTDILERMAAAKLINIHDFKIINPKVNPGFLLNRSTRLYPEWPFSKVLHTSNELAQKVAVALLNMPKIHPAAKAGNYAGWTIPLDYQSVHDLLIDLHLPPYEYSGRFTLLDAIKKYWYWLLVTSVFVAFMLFMTAWVSRLNRELKQAKLHLEQQYELILNSVADGILGVDMEGNTTFANRAMTQITGWAVEELLGKNQHQILHHTRADGTPHPADQCPVYATCRDQIPRFVNDDVFWKKDGGSFPVEYSSTPIKNAQFKTVGSVVVFRDISDRKRIDEEARQHQDDLAHVARLSTMGEMASGIAHEINQPLTAIATNAHACIRMLESNNGETERVIDVMERIGAQAARAGKIIRHLRQFVKKEQPELSLIDINEVINEVITLLRTEIRKAGVRIDLELDEHVGAVLAQHVQIDQVILNLARNAIEAMLEVPEGTRVLNISTRNLQDGYVKVVLRDTGPGLDASIADQLFNPFVTTKSNGMGLGLSISQGIIEAHKGRIFVESDSRKGATFVFQLPTSQTRETAS